MHAHQSSLISICHRRKKTPYTTLYPQGASASSQDHPRGVMRGRSSTIYTRRHTVGHRKKLRDFPTSSSSAVDLLQLVICGHILKVLLCTHINPVWFLSATAEKTPFRPHYILKVLVQQSRSSSRCHEGTQQHNLHPSAHCGPQKKITWFSNFEQ